MKDKNQDFTLIEPRTGTSSVRGRLLNNEEDEGFTLIELLIVIGIIAILASAVIVSINPGRQFAQARNATRWSHMNSLVNSVYSYAIIHDGQYPDCIVNPAGQSSSTDDHYNYFAAEEEFIDASACAGELIPVFTSGIPGDPQAGETIDTDSVADDDSCYGIKLEGENYVIIKPFEDSPDCDDITDDVTGIEVMQ